MLSALSSVLANDRVTSGLVGGLVGTLVGEEVGSRVTVTFRSGLSSVSPPAKASTEKSNAAAVSKELSPVLSPVSPPMLSNESPTAAVSSELVGTLVGCE